MLHARIRALRQKAGMSQAELAEFLNVSASALGMYEQGRRVPGLDALVLLSRLFDVSLDYLITGSEFRPARTAEDPKQTALLCPCSTCFWKEYIGK